MGTDLCVLLESQHDFGSSIPASRDVFGHETCFSSRGFCGLYGSREAEVAHFEITVGVEKEIGGFEIPMDDVCGMKSFQSSEGLVYEVLGVVV